MLAALINFAAGEPSKVPFYVAGVVFALWAVILAFLGLTRPAFPYGRGGQIAVIAISAVLCAAAVGTAIGTGSTEKHEAAPASASR